MVRVLTPKGALLIANLNSFIMSSPGGWIKDLHGRYLHYPVDRYLEEFPEWWSGQVFGSKIGIVLFRDIFGSCSPKV
jgi:hypothetical protein